MAAVIRGDAVKSHTDDPLAGPTVPPRQVPYSHDHTQDLEDVSGHAACSQLAASRSETLIHLRSMKKGFSGRPSWLLCYDLKFYLSVLHPTLSKISKMGYG